MSQLSSLAQRARILGIVAAVVLGGCANSPTAECGREQDCPPGETCSSGRCVPGPDAASVDASDRPDAGTTLPDGQAGDAETCLEQEFPFQDLQESFFVPPTAKYMVVKLWGAGGNDEGICPWSQNHQGTDGGQGGFTYAVFEIRRGTRLAPGTELVVIVGQKGQAGTNSRFGFGIRGGGGLTGIFFGPGPIQATDRDRALAIAGGGGSAAPPGCHPGKPGNAPDAGGLATMQGGEGQDPDQVIGGGAGYSGGEGGDLGVPGKGGSGYVDEELALDFLIEYSEYSTTERFPVPRSDDPDYNGTAGDSEQPGLAVIKFVCERPRPL